MINLRARVSIAEVLEGLNNLKNFNPNVIYKNLQRIDESESARVGNVKELGNVAEWEDAGIGMGEGYKKEVNRTQIGYLSLIRELHESYIYEWTKQYNQSLNDVKVNNVYRMIKQAAFGHTQRGRLTGSSIRAMKTRIYGKTLVGGYLGDAWWPDGVDGGKTSRWRAMGPNTGQGAGEANIPMDRFIGTSGIVRQRFMSKGIKSTYAYTLRPKYDDPVKVSWGKFGLRIKWPKQFKDDMGYVDMEFDPEPMKNKTYGKWPKMQGGFSEGRNMSLFALSRDNSNFTLSVRDAFVNGVMMSVGDYVESLWRKPSKPSDISKQEALDIKYIAQIENEVNAMMSRMYSEPFPMQKDLYKPQRPQKILPAKISEASTRGELMSFIKEAWSKPGVGRPTMRRFGKDIKITSVGYVSEERLMEKALAELQTRLKKGTEKEDRVYKYSQKRLFEIITNIASDPIEMGTLKVLKTMSDKQLQAMTEKWIKQKAEESKKSLSIKYKGTLKSTTTS